MPLVLLTLAVLLSGTGNADDKPRSEQHTAKIETNGHGDDAHGAPIAASRNQKNPDTTSAAATPETYNYYGNFNYPAPKSVEPEHDSCWVIAGQIATVLSAIFVAIFTGALVVTSYRQWDVAKESADAANRAALAAEETNIAARNAAEAELRAYLSIVRIVIVYSTLDNPDYRQTPGVLGDFIQIIVKNSGRTPAYQTRVTANSWVLPARSILPDDFAYPDLSPPSESGSFMIASSTLSADTEHTFNCPSAPTLDLMNQVRSRDSWLYIYGHIDYVDVFRKPHQTPFCWLYVQGATSTEYGFTIYKDHNDPD